ncbi:exodeoxyribonuclease 7 small subunit [Dorea sp. CAG:317]|jgi:exodeoxyribonuclease VII small subunit|nr:exodeoxyribonuclease 7 small subunit [Dorea sp. CAG:317]
MDKKKETLEEMFTQLESVIKTMEQGDVSLEETFDLYHKGMNMLKSCNDKIDKVEKKMLILDDKGEAHEFEN